MQILPARASSLRLVGVFLVSLLASRLPAQQVNDTQNSTPIPTGNSTVVPVSPGTEVDVEGSGTSTRYRKNGGEWVSIAAGDLALINVRDKDVLDIEGPSGTWKITGKLPAPL